MTRLFAIGLACVAMAGCHDRDQGTPAQREGGAPEPIEITPGQGELVYVYADLAGRFQHVPTPAAIPESSRKVVRVIDPTVKAGERRDYDHVHVVDLSDEATRYTSRVVPRAMFEQRALSALPPGAGSHVRVGGDPAEGVTLAPHDKIILYGTSWCGACQKAREFFESRNVEYEYKDIETDAAAAAELLAKAREAGVPADRVPIIDVRGRLLVGFDPTRLNTILGEPI